MICFSHIYKTYESNVEALKDVNLNIDKGEFVFLTGPSGAGKTTLFRMISAFDRPTSGQIEVCGENLNSITSSEIPFFRRRIGVIYQDFRLLKNRTVIENVKLPLVVLGEKTKTIQEKALKIIDEVGLSHRIHHFPEQLSGGEQQRIAIARALIHQPGVLIADEPTGNLDPDLSREIIGLLDRVNAQGTTVFVASHDLQLVRQLNKRVVEINNGRVINDQ